MKSTFVLLLVGMSALALSANPDAQTAARQGMGSSLAAGLSLKNTSTEEIFAKSPNTQVGTPPAWSRQLFPTGPDYSLTAMFGADVAAVIQISAQSTGSELIPPLNAQAVPDIQSPLYRTWMAVVVSVDNSARGLPGSLIERRRNRPSGRSTPGAELYSYYMEGSQGIDPLIVNKALVEQTSERIGYNGSQDIDGLDFGLGVISYASGPTPGMFQNQVDFFFALDDSCISAVNTTVNNKFTASLQPANSATAYRIQWSGTSWSPVYEYKTPADLELAIGEDHLDALAVDPGRGNVIFSIKLRQGDTRSQLRIHGPLPNGNPTVANLTNYSGQKVTTRIGSNDDTDDIDGVCVLDPEREVLDQYLGFAIKTLPLAGIPLDPMGLSITRARKSGIETLFMQLTGWGPHTPANSTVGLFLVEDGQLGPQLAQLPRTKLDDALDYSIPIPPIVPNDVTIMAIQLDEYGRFSESWMNKIKLLP
jgi:hypothetical protein